MGAMTKALLESVGRKGPLEELISQLKSERKINERIW